MDTTEKRWLEHPGVKTQYLANISPYQWQLFLKFPPFHPPAVLQGGDPPAVLQGGKLKKKIMPRPPPPPPLRIPPFPLQYCRGGDGGIRGGGGGSEGVLAKPKASARDGPTNKVLGSLEVEG